jgi:hypothetical protein
MTLRLTLSCALSLSCTLGAGLPAHAGDNNPRTESVPRALPYEGVLAVDGVPLNGTLEVTFRLWSASAPVAGETPLFEETLPVPFVNGRFSVLLGQAQQGLANAIFDADALYVGITVGGTTLRGRQRIVPVPYALWAAKAADFTVENNLSVAGEVSVAGPLNALGGVRGNVTGDVAATSLALTGVADVFGDAAEINFCAGDPGRCEAFRVPTDGFVYVQGKPDTCNAGVGLKDNPILVYLWTQGNLPPPTPRATVMNCGTALVPARRGELAVVLAPSALPLRPLFYPLGR